MSCIKITFSFNANNTYVNYNIPFLDEEIVIIENGKINYQKKMITYIDKTKSANVKIKPDQNKPDKNVYEMIEKLIMNDCKFLEDKQNIILSGKCIVINSMNTEKSYVIEKEIIIKKDKFFNPLFYDKEVINDCLLCGEEKIMYKSYQMCSKCYKLLFTLNKNNRKYKDDMNGYLRLLNKTKLWKGNGLPNGVMVPSFNGF